MPGRVLRWARVAAPRAIAIGWAAWAAATAAAYVDGAPPQLERLENALGIPIWGMWATAATLLALGSVIPTPRRGKVQDVAGWLRGGGLALTAGLLGLWAVEFFLADQARGYVSGKNYMLLAACALSHSWYVGRHRAPPRRGDD